MKRTREIDQLEQELNAIDRECEELRVAINHCPEQDDANCWSERRDELQEEFRTIFRQIRVLEGWPN